MRGLIWTIIAMLGIGGVATVFAQVPREATPRDVAPQRPWTASVDPRTEPTVSTPTVPTPTVRRDSAVSPAAFQEVDKGPALSPPGKSAKSFGEHGAGSLPSLFTMVASLTVVLGLFFLMTWLFRRGMPTGVGMLPKDVVEVLGRAPVANRQSVHLIRCGGKLLLVSATPGGMDALTEITDPVEVDRLLGLCRQSQPGSVTGTFKQLLHQFGREKPARKTGIAATQAEEDATGGLFDEEIADA